MTSVDFGYGVNVTVALFGLLCALCIVLAYIDIRSGIIPNWLNLTIGVLGVSKVAMLAGFPAALEAVGEAAAIGLIAWLLRRLYFAIRHFQGLGLGDVKFLAASATWVGVAGIPVLLLTAALTALVFAGVMEFEAGLRVTRSAPWGWASG